MYMSHGSPFPLPYPSPLRAGGPKSLPTMRYFGPLPNLGLRLLAISPPHRAGVSTHLRFIVTGMSAKDPG